MPLTQFRRLCFKNYHQVAINSISMMFLSYHCNGTQRPPFMDSLSLKTSTHYASIMFFSYHCNGTQRPPLMDSLTLKATTHYAILVLAYVYYFHTHTSLLLFTTIHQGRSIDLVQLPPVLPVVASFLLSSTPEMNVAQIVGSPLL